MRLTEILKLVRLNLSQNKSKVILTSTGILVGAATIMLVIAIGTGGKEEVAEVKENYAKISNLTMEIGELDRKSVV